MNSLILAIALITTESEDFKADDLIRAAIVDYAINSEIMDEREKRYLIVRDGEFVVDLRLLRRRYKELVDCPKLLDGSHLPTREIINDLLSFNRAYRGHLDAKASIDIVNWWEIRQAILQTDQLYHKLDAIRDCKCEYYYITVRRQALKKVRDENGGHLYNIDYTPVPIRYFQRIYD